MASVRLRTIGLALFGAFVIGCGDEGPDLSVQLTTTPLLQRTSNPPRVRVESGERTVTVVGDMDLPTSCTKMRADARSEDQLITVDIRLREESGTCLQEPLPVTFRALVYPLEPGDRRVRVNYIGDQLRKPTNPIADTLVSVGN